MKCAWSRYRRTLNPYCLKNQKFGNYNENLNLVPQKHEPEIATLQDFLQVPLFSPKIKENFQDEEHEEIKEWVLAISVEQSMERALPVDSNGNFEASLTDVDGTTHPACIISGFV